MGHIPRETIYHGMVTDYIYQTRISLTGFMDAVNCLFSEDSRIIGSGSV